MVDSIYRMLPERGRIQLNSPTAIPNASSFLWNRRMMLQASCRGYVVSQFMQPEPAKYSHGPNMEAKSFMQPEHPYYAHHPGRFFYIKDRQSGQLFSAPYEPVRQSLDSFSFEPGQADIRWQVSYAGVTVELVLNLAANDVLEMWQVNIINNSPLPKSLSFYPCFSIGYMSWMNQSACFDPALNAVVASSVTPYQKVDDYFRHQHFKDKTFMLAQRKPDAWAVNRHTFEGEGGLHCPDAVMAERLPCDKADYQSPIAVMQYDLQLAPAEQQQFRFLFGPAQSEQEIVQIRTDYLSDAQNFADAAQQYQRYITKGQGVLHFNGPEPEWNAFCNQWLPRQVYYHGDVNRLSTDPQTRNYLQDNLGSCYIGGLDSRQAFITALSQQHADGAMPDGILLHPDAELKYINQVPHADHCVWLPICLQAYLHEHDDYALLQEQIPFKDGEHLLSVKEHINMAMEWLMAQRDHRGLSYIQQGDWCDPMNMAGYKGKGVSGWLSLASAWALNIWADICQDIGDQSESEHFRQAAAAFNDAVNTHLWMGEWYARGITDDGRIFGGPDDNEGRIFLNPQSWAMLSGAADADKIAKMQQAISQQLQTPYGPMMLAPAYTAMVEDVGRVTQKSPGVAENGSVYNHAAAFYAYALYQGGFAQQAYQVIRNMLPNADDVIHRGQLPNYIPNYYRGAYFQLPDNAGKSSQLFNTGTVAWVYRCLVEGLCGLRGCRQGLVIAPQIPDDWSEFSCVRQFRGATFEVDIIRADNAQQPVIWLNGQRIDGNIITGIEVGKTYTVRVEVC